MTKPSARISIDGEAVIALLEKDDGDAGAPTDFSDAPVPPVLDRIFADIISEYMARHDRDEQAGGSARRAPRSGRGYAEAVREIKSHYTEFVPANSKAKNACLARFEDRKPLGAGRYGVVYDAVVERYRYAVKTVMIYPFAHRLLYENLVNEIEIGRKMGEAGVGPRVHAVHWCERDGGLLVMIVIDLMSRGDLVRFSQAHAVTEEHVAAIRKKLRAMHRLGYLHNDIHARNVLVHEPEEGSFQFFLSDFGFSRESADSAARREETRRVSAFLGLARRDHLRGLLYRMVRDGRIRANIRFEQRADAAAGDIWDAASTYSA